MQKVRHFSRKGATGEQNFCKILIIFKNVESQKSRKTLVWLGLPVHKFRTHFFSLKSPEKFKKSEKIVSKKSVARLAFSSIGRLGGEGAWCSNQSFCQIEIFGRN